MNHNDILTKKVSEERNVFRLHYADKNPLDVYDDCYKINFYEEYYGLLTSNFTDFTKNNEVVEWLCQYENPIAFLYEQWLSCDDAFSGDWDEMLDWLDEIYWEHRKEV